MWFESRSVCGAIRAPVRRTRAPIIHAAAARNREGHRERPVMALVTRWIGARTAKSATRPAIRAAPRGFSRAGEDSAIAVDGDAVQFHAVVDEAKAELLCNPFLQCLEFIVDELNYGTRLHVDQMVVMRV